MLKGNKHTKNNNLAVFLRSAFQYSGEYFGLPALIPPTGERARPKRRCARQRSPRVQSVFQGWRRRKTGMSWRTIGATPAPFFTGRKCMNEDGSNLINGSILRALVRREAILEKMRKDATNALNAHHKKIKALGVDVGSFKAIFKQITAQDGGDGYIQNLREQRRLAQLLELPIGHQFNLIDEFDAIGKVNEEIGVKAYRDGARAHLDHVEEADCPHPAGSAEGQEWLRGWRYSSDLCGDGEREIAAMDAGAPGPDEAAEDTIPAEPTTMKKKRGRPRKDASANGAAAAAH